MSKLSHNIKRLRVSAKLTQEDAARKINVRGITWSRWERGEAEPSIARLRTIAKVLDTTVVELIGG